MHGTGLANGGAVITGPILLVSKIQSLKKENGNTHRPGVESGVGGIRDRGKNNNNKKM